MSAPDSWLQFAREGLCQPGLVRNAAVQTHLDSLAGHCLPVTVNRHLPSDTSWIASLPNAYGPYARAELRMGSFGALERAGLTVVSHVAQGLLRVAGLQGAVILNSWLLSTDLLARSWTAGDLTAAAQRWAGREPGLPVVVRSLTPAIHAQLLAGLRARGWRLLPTRQVWLTDELHSGHWRRHRDVRRDLALAAGTPTLSWSDAAQEAWTEDDYLCAQALYAQLYRQKYPEFNPDYAAAFFRLGVQAGWLQLHGLRDSRTSRLCGVLGYVVRDDWLVTPVLGYDLQAPLEQGLYRLLMLRAWLAAEQQKVRMHCSAGAARFKQSRGARPHWEFSAVWAPHLSSPCRKTLSFLETVLVEKGLPRLAGRLL